MIIRMFSVHDKAAGAFLQPFAEKTRASAIRAFSDAVNDEKSQFFAHRADYTLYEVGEFDDANGRYTTEEPVRLVSALECVPRD